MTPAEARQDYRESMAIAGETVALRREGQPQRNAPGLRARVIGFTPDEIASGYDQGGRKIILLAEDVEAAIASGAWPAPASGVLPIVKTDRILVRGRALVVQTVDDSTRRVQGTLIAYEIMATGLS